MSIRTLAATATGSPALRGDDGQDGNAVRRERKTVGILMDYMAQFIGSYQSHFRRACHTMGRKFDVNVILVYGGALARPGGAPVAQNTIFDLVDRDCFDGLVFLSSSLSMHCGHEALGDYLKRYAALPRCSVGLQLSGIPSIVIDNRRSMQAMVEHMITTHGCRRIACINGPLGNAEAQERFEGYRYALEQHAIPFDATLVAEGNFMTSGGQQSMEEILARRSKFDAVVAANDLMALAAVQVLHQRGLRVPHDIPVTGFDNLSMAGLENPPLTTVAQPFSAMAEHAFRVVLDQIEGRVVNEVTTLIASAVVRRSCGCGHYVAPAFREGSLPVLVTPEEYLRIRGPFLIDEIVALTPPNSEQVVLGARRLLSALQLELLGQTPSFVPVLEDLLGKNQCDDDYLQWLRRALDCLRQHLRQYGRVALENLWYEARDLIESTSRRSQLQHRLQLDQGYATLLDISEQAWRELSLSSFRQCLAQRLPILGIRTASISLYPEGNRNKLESYMILFEGNSVDAPPTSFPARALMPPYILQQGQRRTMVVFALVVESRQFGVVAFEDVPDMSGFQMLRDHVSTALGGILLHHEVIQKTAQHERSVQERQATTKRLEALSLLAGGVAHDLNNAIGPLVALPEVILRELDHVRAGGDPSEVRADLETIKTATLRAAQTIKDLLTLGRQGRTAKVPLDLCSLVTTCLSDESARLMRDGSQVQLVVEAPQCPLVIRGSDAHLARAISNLLRNAVEAISGPGQVKIRLFELHTETSMAGYEWVEPGDYAVVEVSDSGHGMPLEEFSHIFEPFYSKKRLGDRCGSGLGLAIVHGVVKEHEGFLDLASQPGIGTTFTLYFPQATEALQPQERNSVVHRGSARILLVDDETIQLRTGRRILGGLGYDIETVDSGSKALDLFAQAVHSGSSPFDLVVMDMNLKEDTDGLDCFDQIRRLFPEQRVILMSGHSPNERVELAFQRGLLWLSKPYSSAALASAVENALDEHPSQSMVKLPSKVPSLLPQPKKRGIDCK